MGQEAPAPAFLCGPLPDGTRAGSPALLKPAADARPPANSQSDIPEAVLSGPIQPSDAAARTAQPHEQGEVAQVS